MGIPRLNQDLQPYADIVSLGDTELDSSDIQIKSVVIDGPSLVYHVYGQLLAYNCANGSFAVAKLPSYSQINFGVQQFLTDLTRCGVLVIGIIFDGSLPEIKRSVRFERLERTRQQLESFRRLHPKLLAAKSAGDLEDTISPLWHSLSLSSRQHTLPPPPFLVAAAIETLVRSKWKNITCVVDGEADAFCAAVARSKNIAVLSNDSDLALYDLGADGCVIQFYSLGLKQSRDSTSSTIMGAKALRSLKIARQLGIADLLRFGFERSKDSSVSTAVISQRTKETSTHQANNDAAWTVFRTTFQHNSSEDLTIEQTYLPTLDPRIAEIVSSLRRGDTEIHSYLPMLLEDPTRDSSWSYGKQIRQLGYSILFCSNTTAGGVHRCRHVLEYSRRGQRIADEKVPLLSQSDLHRACERFLKRIDSFLNKQQSDRDCEKLPIQYMRLALQIVLSSKISAGRNYDLAVVRRVFELDKIDVQHSWDDIHLNGNIQAIIYSIRILKQLAEFSLYTTNISDTQVQHTLSELVDHLRDMPNLGKTLLDLTERSRCMSNFPTEERRSWLQSLFTTLQAPDSPDEEAERTGRVEKSHGSDKSAIPYLSSQNQVSSETWIKQNTLQRDQKASRGSCDKRKSRPSQNPTVTMVQQNHQNVFEILRDTD